MWEYDIDRFASPAQPIEEKKSCPVETVSDWQTFSRAAQARCTAAGLGERAALPLR